MPTRQPGSRAHTLHHSDGTIWAKGRMRGSVMVGYWEWFRKNGTIMRSGSFEDGTPVGEWTTYNAKGEVHKVTRRKSAG